MQLLFEKILLAKKTGMHGLFSIVLMVVLVAVNTVQAVDLQKTRPLKIGFVMVGSAADGGWNMAHEQGRLYLQSKMKGKVQTTVAERIPESAEAERVMEKMISQGNRLLFATSYGYLEPALRVAARHPEVIILQCARSIIKRRDNVASYFVDRYQNMYVAGIIAGRLTKKGQIGYVSSHPVPPLIVALNAFALGAQSVNPKAKIQVVWTESWIDPPTEAEATKSLIDSGVDVIATQLDSPKTAIQTAERNNVYSIGCHVDLHEMAPQGWLTGQRWNWGPLYVKFAQSVIDKTWKPGDHYFKVKDGYSELSPFGKAVPQNVRDQALRAMRDIESGKLVIFKGPLKDRAGKERIPSGTSASTSQLVNMNWLVSGIEGAMPK